MPSVAKLSSECLAIPTSAAGTFAQASSSEESAGIGPGSLEHVHTADAFPLKTPKRISSRGDVHIGTAMTCSHVESTSNLIDTNNPTTVCHGHNPSSTNEQSASQSQSTNQCTTSACVSVNDNVSSNGHNAHVQSRTVTSSECSQPPFQLLPGEFVVSYGHIQDSGIIYLTNYRFFTLIDGERGFHSVPVVCIDSVEARDLFSLLILCKDGKMFKLSAQNNQTCLMWYKELTSVVAGVRGRDDVFAVALFAWCKDTSTDHSLAHLLSSAPLSQTLRTPHTIIEAEFRRLRFDTDLWHVSNINETFGLCSSYPQRLIQPISVTDKHLKDAAKFRFYGRIPTAVWRDRRTGVVLLRSGQPGVAILGWRSEGDERILGAVIDAVSDQNKQQTNHAHCNGTSNGHSHNGNGHVPNGQTDPTDTTHCVAESVVVTGAVNATPKPMLIVDARSYTAALANRAKGGGFENAECYQHCEVLFMGLANIHNIRNSFQQLRSLLAPGSSENYLAGLQTCQWLSYVSNLLCAAVRVVDAMQDEGRCVLVHCSDGWDRTAQIVSLSKLMLDPHYRTMQGFSELVSVEWIQFGHKFSDRCGTMNQEPNERSPVFLQWLDCVHQLHEQFPCAFEFSQLYLVKLAQHAYSGMFGTFLCNSLQEWLTLQMNARTFDVWSYLHSDRTANQFRNVLYEAGGLLWPRCRLADIRLWRMLYCHASFPVGGTDSHPCMVPLNVPSQPQPSTQMNGVDKGDSGSKASLTLPRAHSCDSLTDIVPSNHAHAHDVFDVQHRTASNTQLNHSNPNESNGHVEAALSHSVHGLCVASDNIPKLSSAVPVATTTSVSVSENGSTPTPEHDQPLMNGSGNVCGTEQGLDAVHALDPVSDCIPAVCLPIRPIPMPMTVDSARAVSVLGMLTSTTEISDSAVHVHTHNARHSHSQSPNHPSTLQQRVHACLDEDGLVKVHAPQWTRLNAVIGTYLETIDQMNAELHSLRRQQRQLTAERRHARQMVNGQGKDSALMNGHSNDVFNTDQMDVPGLEGQSAGRVSECPSEEPGLSVGSVSECSWEAVDDTDTDPVRWFPDHSATNCMGCDTRFGGLTMKRKHHCRACGRVYCAWCSDYKSAVPTEQIYGKVRVCRACYERLNPGLHMTDSAMTIVPGTHS